MRAKDLTAMAMEEQMLEIDKAIEEQKRLMKILQKDY